MSASASALPPLPLRNSYWVIPGLVLAGEHPLGSSEDKTRDRLKRLRAAGIECFVDLTRPGEISRYDEQLPLDVEYLRKPIKDHGLPDSRADMIDILASIRTAQGEGRAVYVHCRAGIGRTGMVMGCLLVESGLAGDDALRELNRLWQQCRRSRNWPSIPETDEQTDFVRRWIPALPRQAAPASTAGAPGGAKAVAGASAGAKLSGGRVTVSLAIAPQAELPADDPLLDPSTLSAAKGLRDRFLGTLIGLAVADAVAAATQFRRPGTFTPVGDLLGGGPFDLPRGAWSDDTAMTLCLAESLLECDGFDARDQVERYSLWQQEGYLSSTGQCVGITASVTRALAVSRWRRQVFAGSHDPDQLDPEPLSRVAAVALFYFATLEAELNQAAEAARTTCQAPGVLEACRQLARALQAGLSGQGKDRILAGIEPIKEHARLANTTAPAALAAACWAFRSTGNFRDAVLRAANVGGNSDVVASVCGQLAGSYYGVSAIPLAWRNSLIHKDLIEGFADRLLAHALLGLGN
ncbi:MAG TPA: ADP-ribosylglycohydrolase family protein [Steroidobacteraceae bacterium]|nr:ADP-ribosylglycohydrolase family protein [Steroidobacteraceae bacterium]